MVICVFGENCTGKSAIADRLMERLHADVYNGKDYLRFAKNEPEAKTAFSAMLADHAASDQTVVYVAAEPEQLQLLPEHCLRVLVTAELPVIKERFAARMGGKLPPPVAAMLERKHGMFDDAARDLWMQSGTQTPDDACGQIVSMLDARYRS
jgi:cytidylate kinase